MSTQVEIIEENVETIVGNASDSARKVFHTSVGAVSTVRESAVKSYNDASTYTNQLAEKGYAVSKERREAFNEFVEPYQARVRDFTNELEVRFNKTTEAVLTRLNIPTADSIEQLNKKVASLSRKIDKMSKEK